ncbi:hypothetical protein [Kitasatospora sp. NPDC004272]
MPGTEAQGAGAPPPEGALSDAEAEQFRHLPRRHLSHELDQWETWRTC